MNKNSVTFQGTEDGNEPLITIMYAGMPAGMVKALNDHAWQIMAQFYMRTAEADRTGEPAFYDGDMR